jgi:hypothetical protein
MTVCSNTEITRARTAGSLLCGQDRAVRGIVNLSERHRDGDNRMDRTIVFDGHEYRDADGKIYDSANELVGTVLLDFAKEYWIVDPAGAADGWLVHVNETDARETAIQGLISSTY